MDKAAFRERYGPAGLVTGASSGIGVAFAELLAEAGIDLVLVARRVERMDALADRLRDAHGIRVRVSAIDLSDPGAAAQIHGETAAEDIGLVVSNAGFGLKGPHEGNDPVAMTAMLAVNCNVPMLLTHGFIPRLRARGRGGIILTSSIEALIGCPYSGVYSASKAFVNALGEALWAELSSEGIDVLTLCPGATESEAAGLQGIDIRTLNNVMAARDVIAIALDQLGDGPLCFPSAHYKGMMDQLLTLPKADALAAMAQGMKR